MGLGLKTLSRKTTLKNPSSTPKVFQTTSRQLRRRTFMEQPGPCQTRPSPAPRRTKYLLMETTRSVKITGDETPHVGGKPMNLYLGEKFEYHPLTILDIMRRHYNILHRGIGGETPAYNLTTYYDWAGPPTTTPATAGSNSFIWPFEPDARQGKRYALSFLVKPRHPFASLYAAWAGHMKYRFILKLVLPEDLPPVPFNPPKVGFFPFPPQIQGNDGSDFAAFVASSFWQGGRDNGSVLYNTNQTRSTANEHLSILPDGTYHIDVQVPFSTHYNMLPVLPDTTSTITENVSGIPGSPGWISLSFPALGVTNSTDVNIIRDFKIEVYEAVGDDFVLAHLRPCGISGGFYGWKGILGEFIADRHATSEYIISRSSERLNG